MSSTGKILVPIIIALALGVIVLGAAFIGRAWFTLPFPVLGLGAPPVQPIEFPHSSHVNIGGVDCVFCHRNVTKGAPATVPAVETCLFCHKDIDGGTVNAQEEINKVRTAFDTDTPIDWARVHRLPDHVRFIHEAHIRYFTDETIGVKYGINGEELSESPDVAQTCTICHGDVANKEVVQPKTGQSLKMGTCVDCHRVNSIPTDCTVCHK